MAHFVDVDQSGKFEDTKTDTVVAFSNGISFSVLVPATVKRDCITILRKKITSGPTLYTQLFATLLFFLLEHYITRIDKVTIDKEYFGREASIKQHLLHLLRRAGKPVHGDQIDFGLVGRHSPAHHIAYTTLRGESTPNLLLTTEDILRQFKL
jgi:hypothetical protein